MKNKLTKIKNIFIRRKTTEKDEKVIFFSDERQFNYSWLIDFVT